MTTGRVDCTLLTANHEVIDVSRRESHSGNSHRLGLIVHQLHALLPKHGWLHSLCQLLAMPKIARKNHLAKSSVCFSHSVTKVSGCARNHALWPLTFMLLCISGFKLAGFHQCLLLPVKSGRDDR